MRLGTEQGILPEVKSPRGSSDHEEFLRRFGHTNVLCRLRPKLSVESLQKDALGGRGPHGLSTIKAARD